MPKTPIVPVEHHKQKQDVIKKTSPEIDGNELERKLAAQRAKKPAEPLPEQQQTEEPSKTEKQPEATPVEPCSSRVEDRKTSFEELEEQMQREVEEEEKKKVETGKEEPKKEPSPEKEPKREISPLLPIPPPLKLKEEVRETPASPTSQKKHIVPSPLLMEAIRQECG